MQVSFNRPHLTDREPEYYDYVLTDERLETKYDSNFWSLSIKW